MTVIAGQQDAFVFQALWRLITHMHVQFDLAVFIIFFKIGFNKKILDMRHRFGIQKNIPLNAGKPPKILIFQITAVTPSIDFHG